MVMLFRIFVQLHPLQWVEAEWKGTSGLAWREAIPSNFFKQWKQVGEQNLSILP